MDKIKRLKEWKETVNKMLVIYTGKQKEEVFSVAVKNKGISMRVFLLKQKSWNTLAYSSYPQEVYRTSIVWNKQKTEATEAL